MPAPKKTNRDSMWFPLTLLLITVVGFVQLWTVKGTLWDDNAWLMSVYATHNLREFLDTSFVELRRVPLGAFLYPLYWLHKNTEAYYAVWHSLNMLTQIASPLLLYALCVRLFNERLLAFLIAAALTAIAIDQTVVYAAAVNYRIGLMLSIASFYFMVRALQGERVPWMFGLSFIIAVVCYVVFMEAAIALEPGRFLIIVFMLYRQRTAKGWPNWSLYKPALLWWAPFALFCTGFAVYKLLYPSYGLYAGIYQPSFSFLFDLGRLLDMVAMVLLFQWVIFAEQLAKASVPSIVLGIVGLGALIWLLRRKGKSAAKPAGRAKSKAWDRKLPLLALGIGVVLLIVPLGFFQFFHRPVTWGISSSHGAIAQFGYAIVIGTLLFLLLRRAAKGGSWRLPVVQIGVALFLAIGVFFNNLNIDICKDSYQRQLGMWKQFVAKLPALQPGTTFLFDIDDGSIYNPLYYYYYEFIVNLLYAESPEPKEFRRYRVTTFYELYWMNRVSNDEELRGKTFVRDTLWGKDHVDPRNFVWIHFKNGELLINEEIAKQHPDSSFRQHLNKPLPPAPPGQRNYLYRSKLLPPS